MKPAILSLVIVALSGGLGVSAAPSAEDPEFTEEFALGPCSFSTKGSNAYFSIEPGERWVLEGEEGGAAVRREVTVLGVERWVTFVTARGETLLVETRVVEERERRNGRLTQVSRSLLARCVQTNDIYDFGEEVDRYENGKVKARSAWRAGLGDARPGLRMPGTFLLGARYVQHGAPGPAARRVEHVAMGFDMDVPAGFLEDCVEVAETSPLEPGAKRTKVYCAGVGLAVDDTMVLVEHLGARD